MWCGLDAAQLWGLRLLNRPQREKGGTTVRQRKEELIVSIPSGDEALLDYTSFALPLFTVLIHLFPAALALTFDLPNLWQRELSHRVLRGDRGSFMSPSCV